MAAKNANAAITDAPPTFCLDRKLNPEAAPARNIQTAPPRPPSVRAPAARRQRAPNPKKRESQSYHGIMRWTPGSQTMNTGRRTQRSFPPAPRTFQASQPARPTRTAISTARKTFMGNMPGEKILKRSAWIQYVRGVEGQ